MAQGYVRYVAAFAVLLSAFATVRAQTLIDDQLADPTSAGVAIPQGRATVAVADAPPVLDGILDEPFWELSEPATGFWDNFPSDTVQSGYQTEIRFAADATTLYVAAKCYASGDNYVVPSLRRDFRAGGSDNLTFIFDPFRQGRNAIVFGINPYGVNREALISNGGANPGDDFSEAWDNKWRGEAKIFDGYWTCELAIPLRSLRYPAAGESWGFNAYRFDTQSNSQSTWQRIPRQQPITTLAYMGDLDWQAAPGKAGGVATLIPYVAGSAQRDYAGEPFGKTLLDAGVGGDAKIAVSSGLNLDLTINPDFSQVEVDRQVLNLTRFEIGFPERRQFFLENADLFGGFGFEGVNPFFSRRIGLARDPTTGASVPNTIYYGARLSGQVGEDWRVGLLNMQTAASKDNGLPAYNYTVAAAQRRIGARSSIGGIVVSKDNFTSFSDSSGRNRDYNRVYGVDYNLATSDNRWTGKAFVHASTSPEPSSEASPGSTQTEAALAHGLDILYSTRRFDLAWDHAFVADDYRPEVGFVPRRDFWTGHPEVTFRTFPKTGNIAGHGPFAEWRWFLDGNLSTLTDQRAGAGYSWQWRTQERLTAQLRYTMVRLDDDFDPSRSGAEPLPGDARYDWANLQIGYRSDRRQKFSYDVNAELGQFFNGEQYGLDVSALYRVQPYGTVGIDAAYSYLDLPKPFAQTNLLLLGPRVDVTFTKSLFLTTVAQYNNQLENLNLNVRFQWRYAAVSDFFIVYSDNYDTRFGESRNRSIVAKLTYWLNL